MLKKVENLLFMFILFWLIAKIIFEFVFQIDLFNYYINLPILGEYQTFAFLCLCAAILTHYNNYKAKQASKNAEVPLS